jgi:hypothetical protein
MLDVGYWTFSRMKDWATVVSGFTTTIGLLAGAGYFIFKVRSGYEVLNVRLAIRCERAPKPESEMDFLAVTAIVSKGDRGSVLVQDAQAQVIAGGACQRIHFIGVERLSIERVQEDWLFRHVVRWGVRSRTASFLNLTPGEETQFSCLCEVPRKEPCTIEAVLLGHRPGSRRIGQWRASQISLPAAHTET